MAAQTPLPAAHLFQSTPASASRLGRVPPPPTALTPGRPGLERVLDLVTEHETHYRHQARQARGAGARRLRAKRALHALARPTDAPRPRRRRCAWRS
jgi:hypothetical protein